MSVMTNSLMTSYLLRTIWLALVGTIGLPLVSAVGMALVPGVGMSLYATLMARVGKNSIGVRRISVADVGIAGIGIHMSGGAVGSGRRNGRSAHAIA
jgi:hypothetical protein